MKHIRETLAILVKLWILGTSVYNVYMEARMSLLNVSQEYSFCACAVLSKIALFRQNPVFAVGSINNSTHLWIQNSRPVC